MEVWMGTKAHTGRRHGTAGGDPLHGSGACRAEKMATPSVIFVMRRVETCSFMMLHCMLCFSLCADTTVHGVEKITEAAVCISSGSHVKTFVADIEALTVPLQAR